MHIERLALRRQQGNVRIALGVNVLFKIHVLFRVNALRKTQTHQKTLAYHQVMIAKRISHHECASALGIALAGHSLAGMLHKPVVPHKLEVPHSQAADSRMRLPDHPGIGIVKNLRSAVAVGNHSLAPAGASYSATSVPHSSECCPEAT
jgi:hypothetical protein